MAAGAGLLTLIAWEASAGSDFFLPAKLSSLSATSDVGEEEFWNMVRTQMMLKKDIMYLNNGSFGSTPRIVFDAVVKGFRMIAEDPKNKRNALWVSTHFYNTKKEVDACLEGIEEIAKNGLGDLSPIPSEPDFMDY